MSNIPQQGGPTEDDGDELLFEGVNLPAKWSRTQVRDWSLLHPRVPHTSMRLYLVVRSMIIENDKRGGAGLRPLTYDQLCWLLPGVNGKPTSLTTVKDALRVLDAEGLMTNPDDRRIVTSTGRGKVQVLRRFQVHDFPRDDYRGWRNAWDKLAAYRPDWRENPPEPPPLPPVPVGYRRPGVVPSLETAGQGPAAGPAAPDAGNPAPNDGTSPNETPDEVPSLETAGQGPAAGPAAPDAGNPAPNDGTSPN
ncbi:hypothetical protein ACH4U8_45705, partial [Embleya sp. NPDC020886]